MLNFFFLHYFKSHLITIIKTIDHFQVFIIMYKYYYSNHALIKLITTMIPKLPKFNRDYYQINREPFAIQMDLKFQNQI